MIKTNILILYYVNIVISGQELLLKKWAKKKKNECSLEPLLNTVKSK